MLRSLWLRKVSRALLGRSASCKQRRSLPPRTRLNLESLEGRIVPTTTMTVSAGDTAGLIADINQANQNSSASNPYVIDLTYSASKPFVFSSANNSTNGGNVLPVIKAGANLTIEGNGSTLNASSHGRLFDVASGGSLSLQNLTLQGGLVRGGTTGKGNGTTAEGGAIYCGVGSLTLSGVTVKSNKAVGGNGHNGNIFPDPVGGSGGSGLGGGVYVAGGTVTLIDDTLSNNQAQGGQGGFGAGAIEWSANSFQGAGNGGNGGNALGGGLCVAAGTVTLINDTLSNNQVQGSNGGFGGAGADNHFATPLPTAGNGGNGGNGMGGGLYVASGSSTYLANNLIAENTLATGAGGSVGATTGAYGAHSGSSGSAIGPDVAGIVNSSDHDLIGDSSGFGAKSLSGTIANLNPKLGPLQNNGGPTQTMALLPGSPAIDAGDSSAAGLPKTDQRGFARNVGNAVDIGAFEYQYDLNVNVQGPVNFNVPAGQPISYTITVTNNGPDTAGYSGPVTLTDDLSSGFVFSQLTSASSGWDTTLQNGTFTATTSTMAPGASANFTLTVPTSLSSPSLVSNTAYVGPITWDHGSGAVEEDIDTAVLQPAPTTTALSSSVSSSVSGQSVTFTAIVSSTSSGKPTGTVTFSDAGGPLGTGTLSVVNGQDEATFTTSVLAVGNTTITATYSGDSNFAGSNTSLTQQVNAVTASNLQATLNSTTQATFQESDNTDAQTLLNSIDSLSPPTKPVTITVDLASGSYTDLVANPPSGVTLIIDGVGGSTTIVGHSPALTVVSGAVEVDNMTLTTATNAPTILVEGGSLTLNGDTIDSSTGYNQTALDVTGGSLALGSANTIDVNGAGQFLQAASFNGITERGDVLEHNGNPIPASLLSLTSLASSSANDTSVYGKSIALTATVSTVDSGKPTGSVDFFDATTKQDLGSAPVVAAADGSYQAVLNTSALTAGTHNILATYSGDSTYGFSSGSLNQVVNPLAVTLRGSRVYDGTTTANASVLAISNEVQGDTLTLSGSVALASPNVGDETISSFNSLILGGSSASNYTLVGASGSVNVTAAAIGYTIGNDTQAYGYPANLAADLPSTIATGVNGETLDISYSSTGDTATATPGAYAITGTVSHGTGLPSNYTITLNPGTLTVLGSGVSVVGSTLWIVGGTNTNDHIHIDPVGASKTGSTGVKVDAKLNGVHTSTKYDQPFTALYIFLYGGNDNVHLAKSLTINTTIRAGDGNDRIYLGAGNNNVLLGDGKDRVHAGDGANTVTVGNGNDRIHVGNGNNVIVEGNGHDDIYAGNGDNLIVAGLGRHNVHVGNGSNILIDGSVQLPVGDSLRPLLSDWIAGETSIIDSILSQLGVVTYDTQHSTLHTGKGLDWIWTDGSDELR